MHRRIILALAALFFAAAACQPAAPPEPTPTPVARPTQVPTKTPNPTPTPSPDELAAPFYETAFAHQAAEEWELAIEAYNEVLALVPDNAAALINRAICHYMDDDFEAATADIETALAIDYTPDTPQMFVNRGRAQSMIDNYNAAIKDFDRAIEMDAEFTEAYIRRANINIYLENLEAAFSDLEIALQLDPDSELAYHKLAYAHEEAGDYESALTAHSRTIELDPDDPYNYFNRGLAHAYLGDFEAGIADMQQSLALSPELAYAEYFMGMMYSDLNQMDLASEHMARAIDLGIDPDDESYAMEIIAMAENATEEIKPDLAWLISLDELPQMMAPWGIGYWELWDELERPYIACVMHAGLSWSASSNVSENCIFTVDTSMTMDELMLAVEDAGFLSATAEETTPASKLDAEYRVFVDMLDNGHANFSMYLLEDSLLYMSTISFGQSIGSTPAGFYNNSGEEIDLLLYEIIQINLSKQQSGTQSNLDDGSILYGGETSQNERITIKVVGETITEIMIDYDIPGCEDYSRTHMLIKLPIENMAFELEDNTTQIAGQFMQDGTIAGTFKINSHYFCDGELEGTWQASPGFTPEEITFPAKLFPEMVISEELFNADSGDDYFYSAGLDTYGDWVLYQSAMESILPVPKGWTTFETGNRTLIHYSLDPNRETTDIALQLGFSSGTDIEAVIDGFVEQSDGDNYEILQREVLNNRQGFLFIRITAEDGSDNYLLIAISHHENNPSGDLFHIFTATAETDKWASFEPIVRAMHSHWIALDGSPLGILLPENLLE